MVQRIQNKGGHASIHSTVQYSSAKIAAQAGFVACLLLCSCTLLEKQDQDIKSVQKPIKKAVLSEKEAVGQSLSKGKILFKQGKYKEAQKLFEQEELLQSSTLPYAQFYTALTLYKMKDFQKALEKLKTISEEHPSDIQLKNLYLQWKLLNVQKRKDYREQLYVLSQMVRHHSSLDKKQKARDIAISIIQDLSDSEVQKLQEGDRFSDIYDLLLFKTAQSLIKDKKFRKALSQFKELLSYTDQNAQMEERVQQYIQALAARTQVNVKTIGAVLPLTGPHKRIGTRCLNGLQMGLGLYDEQPSNFQLAVVDSKGSSHFIQESMREIVFQHKAIGVVGGVVSQVADSLSRLAQAFMIPLIVLSQKSNLTYQKPFVFQNAVSSRYVIQSLVNTLMDKQGHKNFAILYPNDPFGVGYTNLFWDYVDSKGGNIVGVQTYKPGEVDFNDSVRRLTGTYYFEDRDEEYREKLQQWFSKKRPKRNQKQLKNLLPPVVDFSVLFIPDSIKTLHHIAPYMSFQNIKGVTLAGPGLWNSTRLLKQKKEQIEGAVFADALIVSHPQFKKSSFFTKFKEIFKYDPSLFEFLSYQSALALRQVISSGKESREDLQEGLAQLKKLNSPIGQIQISKNREFIYPITNFSVKNKQIVNLSP